MASKKHEFVRGEGSLLENNKTAHKIRRQATKTWEVGIDGPRTVLATLLATGVLTVLANNEPTEPQPSPTAEIDIKDYHTDLHVGMNPVANDIELPSFRIDLTTPLSISDVDIVDVDHATLNVKQPYTWAPERNYDANAGLPLDNGNKIEQLASSLQGYVSNGYSVESIDVVGHASDEDPSQDPSGGAGLDIKDYGNEELANMRAEAAKDQLVRELHQFMSDEEIDKIDFTTSGSEVQDPVINQLIRDFAARRGMTEAEWVMAFNEDTILDADPDEIATFRTFAIDHRTTDMTASVEKVTVASTTEDGNTITAILIPGLVPFPYAWFDKRKPSVVGQAPKKNNVEKGRTIPENIGQTHLGYQKVQQRRKQPGNWNNGGTNGSRGQRNHSKFAKR